MNESKSQAAIDASQQTSTYRATKPNSKAVKNGKRPLDGREEGELSPSADEDENSPVVAASQSGNSTVPVANIAVLPLKKSAPGVQAGKAVSGCSPSRNSSILPEAPAQQYYQHESEKIQVPCRSSAGGQYAPNVGRNSLVISFSDDDSGSDEDKTKGRKALESKGNGATVVTNQRHPAMTIVKSKNSWKNINNTNKFILNKSTLSNAPKPSVTKMHGVNSRILGPPPVDQKLQARKFSMHNKNLTNQRCEGQQNVGLKSSKLQDLRQQIAIRENELKRKSSHQNKAVSIRNQIGMSENETARKCRSVSAEPQQMYTKGPEQKRLKVGSSHAVQKTSKVHQEVLEKNSYASKEQALPDRYLVVDTKTDHMQKERSASVKEPRVVDGQERDGDQVTVLSKNTANRVGHGPDVNTDGIRPDANRAVDSFDILNKTKAQMDLASVAMPENTNSIETGRVPEQCLQSLVEMEEVLDKELEEAQEYRHRCEIEERLSLRAYHRAQRALLEANARCNGLYRQRELYASRYNTLLLNNSKFSLSSRQHENDGIWAGSFNCLSENEFTKNTTRLSLQPEYDGFNRAVNDLNVRCANSAPCNMPGQHVDGENMGSEHLSEPDASTSELLSRKCSGASRVCSPSSDPCTSADEDEGRCLVHPESEQHNIKEKNKDKNNEELERGLTNVSNNQSTFSNSQDSLQLEAKLRSELFARFGSRASSNGVGSPDNMESAVGPDTEKYVRSEKIQMNNDYNAGKDGQFKLGDDILGDTNNQESVLVQAVACVQYKHNSEKHFLTDESRMSSEEDNYVLDLLNFSPLVLRSVYGHVSYMASESAIQSPSRNLESESRDTCSKQTGPEILCWSNWLNATQLNFLSGKEIGSYTCTTAVDPHWPLCIYELRGRCNNDKCPWQHMKDILNGIEKQRHYETSECADRREGPVRETKISKQDAFAPFYLVAMDILKAEPHPTHSIQKSTDGGFWKKCFSGLLVLSPFFQKNFRADKSFMYESDGRFDGPEGWSRQLFHLQNKNGLTNQLKWCPKDSAQALENALLILNQEVYKLEDVQKALNLLSEAIDADPTCVVLWIVYLIVYYSNKHFDGDDNDIFHHAVEHNQGSYELWLMYINSRGQLDKRLAAYDAGLSAMCHYSSASKRVDMHASACILDIFLQMINCLCMSGNINKAIEKVYELHSSTNYNDKSEPLLLSNILACLTISDKCRFWICCLYLIIYKELPDYIVQQVEFEKEVLDAEWPSVNLVDDEKHRVIRLAEMAADSIRSCTDFESVQSVSNHSYTRAAELFALNHIKCMVAVNGLCYSRSLLDDYLKTYPNCLELVLVSARTCENGEQSFAGFEETLCNWKKEVPGIHCIWNQYAEYALRIGQNEYAKELMVRWFDTVWKVQCHQDGILEKIDGNDPDNMWGLAVIPDSSTQTSNHYRIDLMFGFLNLALYLLLQNDCIGARLAVQRAVKAACHEHYKHCMKELARFLVVDKMCSEKDSAVSGVLQIIKNSLDYSRLFSDSEPLSRKFINTIQRPKVRQLVSSMLSPISADFLTINYILESLNGPTLLPEKLTSQGDLVYFVESILGLQPSNYQFAICVCKLLVGGHVATNVNRAGILYWASLLMVNSILHAIPLPPEHIWAEAASNLCGISGIDPICERFYARALFVYPFSVKLWTSYYIRNKAFGDAASILEAARYRGVELDTSEAR